MKINSLEIFHVAMPLIYPWRTAYGADYDIHSVLVKATSGDHTSWSESTPLQMPSYSPEGAAGVFLNVSEYFAPRVVGQEFESAENVSNALSVFKGNQFAKAALEIVWWTLESKIQNRPLHELLGGTPREVQAGADFGIQDSFDMLLGNIHTAIGAGFPRVKLKVAREWDVDMLRAVRSAFPNEKFHIDCNSGYTLDDLDMFREIDKFNLEFIEQPLAHDDILDHAELARSIDTPICLDESVTSPRVVEQALSIKACEYVNIKPGRVGGLANSVRIHDICQNAGVPVWVGGMLESAVGSAVCVELATLPNFVYPGDLFPSSRFYTRDLGQPEVELTDRQTMMPYENGLPEPDQELLEKFTQERKLIVASG
ncbi:MAG: o-succinylbenzoate synthase [Dehalococcoidia bacterium]|jgi:O-succinylbenzoate synthase|nr:o-succinylbenzoate synthase [Chloroflexota bacterium]MDP6056452.1 o-succinylbenzoate synthase [Dehalococcoidia bacterium]MDP7090500.1 o-succinylbenzoate synthase [Dehalococcoidia bacterium]MDP7261079.1 o-succinylbenzoate synthase [Dehalococcoidia bacterium]MDP7485517.1 o-succinylbenzoate synthase [Dehalococcoidia bacterium]|tara:strand:+ start:4099 stop:5208 length:1110 start_codon:yes stop_codon:yes gene_type:complete